MTIEQILRDGKSPNPMNNATLADANGVKAILAPFLPPLTIAVNTTVAWPANAEMIAVEGLAVPADARLNLSLVMQGVGRTVDFHVANIWRVVTNQGPREAVTICLDVVMPGWWEDDKELAVRVAALPGAPQAPTIFVDQPVAAMPDWDNPRTEGVLGSRVGDHSPIGTVYTSPAGVTWKKGQWLSMFETTWKRA